MTAEQEIEALRAALAAARAECERVTRTHLQYAEQREGEITSLREECERVKGERDTLVAKNRALETQLQNARQVRADERDEALRVLGYAGECFEAALYEGWLEALEAGDLDRLRDVWNRRLSYAYAEIAVALSRRASPAPTETCRCHAAVPLPDEPRDRTVVVAGVSHSRMGCYAAPVIVEPSPSPTGAAGGGATGCACGFYVREWSPGMSIGTPLGSHRPARCTLEPIAEYQSKWSREEHEALKRYAASPSRGEGGGRP